MAPVEWSIQMIYFDEYGNEIHEAERIWDKMGRIARLPPHMLGIPNRRREAVMATRKKYGSRCMVP